MSAFQDRDDALATGGADRDQPAPTTIRMQHLRQRGDDPSARGGERVAGRERRAVDVQLRAVDRAERTVEAEPPATEVLVLPRLEGCEHGAGEGLVDLDEVEVVEAQLVAGQQ